MTRDRMRVALIHDYWVTLRGGEYVFRSLAQLFPEADCYVLIRRRDVPFENEQRRWHTSPLQWIPFGARFYRALLPLYPWAARQVDLRRYDLVVSSSSGFCHLAPTNGVHVCYCHSPLRYAWNEYTDTLMRQRTPWRRAALARILDRARQADYQAAQRVSAYVANSAVVQSRIASYYGLPSTVVPPPIDVDRFRPVSQPRDYFLVVSQLLPYKRVDLAVAACRLLGRNLVVVGEGQERARLQHLAGATATFLGRVSERELVELYSGCLALLQCGTEDFGMAALEAQACGRPVIAFGAGGALDTIVDGQSGLYFTDQTVEGLVEHLQRFDPSVFDPAAIRAHTKQFDEHHFHQRMLRVIENAGVAHVTSRPVYSRGKPDLS
jgi:glycosyltransferase involved in cell wall biosynthesis